MRDKLEAFKRSRAGQFVQKVQDDRAPNLAIHVEDRNFILQRVMSLIMLVIATALLLVSTTAYGLGNLIGALPIALPVGPVLGRLIGWVISLVSAIVMFLLLYKILPNKPQAWKQTLPGALMATVLFFIILQLFPLDTALFPPNQAYAAFGVFLLLMFWLYLLGLVLVAGAELNAFLEEPGRATALAASKARAEKGQAAVSQAGGRVQAEATGTAWAGSEETGGAGQRRPGPFGRRPTPAGADQRAQPEAVGAQGGGGSSIPGKLIGFAGLAVAAVLLRGQLSTAGSESPQR